MSNLCQLAHRAPDDLLEQFAEAVRAAGEVRAVVLRGFVIDYLREQGASVALEPIFRFRVSHRLLAHAREHLAPGVPASLRDVLCAIYGYDRHDARIAATTTYKSITKMRRKLEHDKAVLAEQGLVVSVPDDLVRWQEGGE